MQFDPAGFDWVDLEHRDECVIVYKRKGKSKKARILIILNLTPVPRKNWKIITTGKKDWSILLNSDDKRFGGQCKMERIKCECF